MQDQINTLKEQIIRTGFILYDKGLAVASSGNLSCRLGKDTMLITASGSRLADLQPEDIVLVNLAGQQAKGDKEPSSELNLHSSIYEQFPATAIIHCHPPLVNGYFSVQDSLEVVTFETKLYIGNIAVVKQDAPIVVDPQPVIEALKVNKVVVLKNHGVVSIADTFEEGLGLIEMLEEAVKTKAASLLFQKEAPNGLDAAFKEYLSQVNLKYPLFSQEHMRAIVDAVNSDHYIALRARETNFTLSLSMKITGTNTGCTFYFQDGKVTKLEPPGEASFEFSADERVWEYLFLGKLDPFVAITQARLKLKGDFNKLLRWYVLLERFFKLCRKVGVE